MRVITRLRGLLAWSALAFTLASCCVAEAPCAWPTSHTNACNSITNALRAKCGAAEQFDCSAFFAVCASSPSICPADIDSCTAQIAASATCNDALQVTCTVTCF